MLQEFVLGSHKILPKGLVEQDAGIEAILDLQDRMDTVKAEFELMQQLMADIQGGTLESNPALSTDKVKTGDPFEPDDTTDTQLKTALILASISFVCWALALIFILVKFVLHV